MQSASPSLPAVVVVNLEGHLTEETLSRALRVAEDDLERLGRASVVVDATQMTGYATAAREYFVAWHRRCRERVLRVAIVTNKPLWHMVIHAMSFATSVSMQPFSAQVAALEWARGG
jgi:hypothetical protein